LIEDDELRNELALRQMELQRGLKEAFILNGFGEIELRGERSYLFDFEKPKKQEIEASIKEVVLINDFDNNELRALIYLIGFGDRYLYITREVDGTLFNLLDKTQKTAILYQQMENDRTAFLLNFAVLYFALALLLIVSSVLFALWFAERLSKPIGRLAAAAKRVGSGELTTQVIEQKGDDEISQLGQYFNQMTKQLKQQRDELIENTQQIEERRQLFDSVLSSVTSGVVVLDQEGRVNFTNSAASILITERKKIESQISLADAFPEFTDDDFREQSHLNRSGAQKLTKFVALQIKTYFADDLKIEGLQAATVPSLGLNKGLDAGNRARETDAGVTTP